MSATGARQGPRQVFAVFHRPGPLWRSGVSFREQPGIREHVLHYRSLYEKGQLLLGGPFLDDTGGMMLTFPGVTREEIETFASDDPAVKSGLLAFELKPWMIAMENWPED